MKGTLYLEYSDYTDLNFDVSDTYYTEKSYIDQLNKSVDNKIDYTCSKTDEKVSYTSCEISLPDENEGKIIEYSIKNIPVLINVKFNFNTMEEDFDEEFKNWFFTTKKIKNSSPNKDLTTSILPVKTFKFKLEKSNGDMIYGNMNRCRIINFDGVVMTMLVDNLTILKK